MRIVDFPNFNPGDRTLSIIFNSTGSYWTVKEVNINVTDGEFENLFPTLQNVTGFAFLINGHCVSTTWNTTKVIDEGTNDFDIEASANGTTITFTFKSTSGTKYYSPKVLVEAFGTSINSTYA